MTRVTRTVLALGAALGTVLGAALVAGCSSACEVEPRATVELTDAAGDPIDDALVACTIDGAPQVVTAVPGFAWCVAQPGELRLTVEWRGAVVELGPWVVVEDPELCPAIPSRIFEVVLVE